MMIKQLKGDALYPQYQTLLEKCALYKKYMFCSVLLDLGEGVKLHDNVLNDYFLDNQNDSINQI